VVTALLLGTTVGAVVGPPPHVSPHPPSVTVRAGVLSGAAPTVVARFSVHNLQAVPTGSYDQPVIVPSARYGAWINSNWSNAEFALPNGTALPAWIESDPSNRSSATLVWVRLGSIDAFATQIVNLVTYPVGDFLLSTAGPIGEAPELSGSFGPGGYGAWDDGPEVFPFYANFAGTSLPTGWTASPGISYEQNNGLRITAESADDPGIYSSALFAPPSTVDFYGELQANNGVSFTGFMAPGGTSTCVSGGDCRVIVQSDSRSSPDVIEGEAGSTYGASTTAPYSSGWVGNATWTITWGPSVASFEENYTLPRAVTADIPQVDQSIAAWSTGNVPVATSESAYFSWIRERSAGPGGVLPQAVLAVQPDAPTAINATAVGNSSIYLRWTNPTGSVLANDTIFFGRSCGNWTEQWSTGGPTQGWLISGLLPATSYCGAVQAWNDGGGSFLSAPAHATTLPATLPSKSPPPTNATAAPATFPSALDAVLLVILAALGAGLAGVLLMTRRPPPGTR
jgi:hypothetical protein